LAPPEVFDVTETAPNGNRESSRITTMVESLRGPLASGIEVSGS
jgi:hypothetical protein